VAHGENEFDTPGLNAGEGPNGAGYCVITLFLLPTNKCVLP